jgi:hypothetical protein
MDTFGARELRILTAEQVQPCVSIYLPTHGSGEQAQQDSIRLKKLLQRAEERLSDGGMRAPEARQFLAAARDLPSDPIFWGQRSQGLALFLAPGCSVQYRLPLELDELLFVQPRFHIKPLLPLLSGSERFFILALSRNCVRFFQASRHAIEVLDIPGLPKNMEAALNYSGADRGSQLHSAMHGRLGKQAAVFHGQGGKSDTQKDDLAQYFRQVEAALQPVLRDESTPMLLAGVEYELPIFREVSRYSYIVAPEAVKGNCDYLSPAQLLTRAWPLMAPLCQRAREDAKRRYLQLQGSGRVLADIHKIVPAARQGRVDTLFVDVRALLWGSFDPDSDQVETHEPPRPSDEELLDLAATQTLSHRGKVYPSSREQIPGEVCAAAILRHT